jgi:outer membrane protein assembly factor BamB
LYNLGWNGRIQCINPTTGEEIYNEKLGKSGSFTASPVAADDRIYTVDDNGKVYILQAGKVFKIISEQNLKDICMVTPAITENIIFFRTQQYLIATGN